MSETDRLVGFRAARAGFDDALQDMERFILNLHPDQGQILRNWLRTVAGDLRSDRASAPSLEGWPLAGRISEYVEAVLKARTAMWEAWRLLRLSERDGVSTRPGLR